MNLTESIARIINRDYVDLPSEVIYATKRSILDTLGVMIPPSTLEKACMALAEIAKEEGGKEECTLIGFGEKTSCSMAAFVNGSLTHALDFDDVTDEPPHHPTANSLPAALAVSEKIGNVSGKQFITSIALGNDLGVRLAHAPKGNLLQDYPWFSIAKFGVFSAAFAVGKLLNLTEQKMINAFGIALHRVFGITEAIVDPDSEIRAIRDGFTNKEGLLAALMAAKGITASKDAFEKFFKFYYNNNYDPSVITVDLGRKYKGTEISIKPWPTCRETNGPIQLAIEIMEENNIAADQIERIVSIVGNFVAERCCEPKEEQQNPKMGIAAKFSLPFAVAVALTKQKVEIEDFFPEKLADPKVLGMAKKVTYEINPEFGVLTPASMKIITKQGQTFSKRIDSLYGNPSMPLSDDDLIAKFKDCAIYANNILDGRKIEKIIERVMHLEDVDDIRELTSLFAKR